MFEFSALADFALHGPVISHRETLSLFIWGPAFVQPQTKELQMNQLEIKREAQAMYYKLRELKLDHSVAMGIVLNYVLSAAVPKDAPSDKQTQIEEDEEEGQ